jgi:hypothetical protein
MDLNKTLRTSVLISYTYTKIATSLDEIKRKHPLRTDLIDSMEESLMELHEIKKTFLELENEYRMESKINFRWQLINLEQKEKIKELEIELKARDL